MTGAPADPGAPNEPFGLRFAGRDVVLAHLHDRPSGRLEYLPQASLRPHLAGHALVEGDNLEALRHLTTAYFGRVDLIYIDPPYNTGHEFVYRDQYARGVRDFLQHTGQVDAQGVAQVSRPTSFGRRHSDWLAMMYPRLWAARQLLHEDGIFACSIDDHEVHRLRMLLDEIFGEDCFVAQVVVVTNPGGRDYLRIATGHEYLLVYGATPQTPIAEEPRPPSGSPGGVDSRGPYELRELRNRNPKFDPDNRPNLYYPLFVDPGSSPGSLASVSTTPDDRHHIRVDPCRKDGRPSVWRWGPDKLSAALRAGDPERSEVVAKQRRDGAFNIYEKYRKQTRKPRALWDEAAVRSECGTSDLRALLGDLVFDHPKPVDLVRRCVRLCPRDDGVVLDFFAGSGTTGQAVVEQNEADGGRRRFVGVQIGEPTPEGSIARERGYGTLADLTRARMTAALRERDSQGVRCFRLSGAPETAAGEPAPATTSRLQALRSLERSRSRPHPWSRALELGFAVDAQWRSEAGWDLFHDPRTRAWLAVQGEATQAPPIPEGGVVAVRDDCLDDAWVRALVRAHRVVRRD